MIRSATGRHWELPDEATERDAALIAQRHDLPYLLACVLARRGVGVEEVPEYFDPDLGKLMADPFRMQAMEPAVERFVDAVRNRERISVFGDYDADGASSIALLVIWLRRIGLDATYHVRHRRDGGYGPDPEAMTKLGQDSGLVFIVDCGSEPEAERGLAAARTAGADVLVLDHHSCPGPPAGALAVVNPGRADDDSGLQYLCAAGVVYMFLLATGQVIGQKAWFQDRDTTLPTLDEFLDLVALATVADVRPLQGLNRAFVQRGLDCLAERGHVGLAALMAQEKLWARPDEASIRRVLAPALNAPGRVGEDSGLATALLLAIDPVQADELAVECSQLNLQRQNIQAEVQEKAEQHLKPTKSGILHWSAGIGWNPGVVSSVASRLASRHRQPVIVLTLDGTTWKGSGRAPSGFDLGRAVRRVREEGHLSQGDGHAHAVRVVIERERVETAMERIGALLAELTPAGFEPEFRESVVGLLTPHAVTVKNYEVLQRAGPYDDLQAQWPKFVFRGLRVIRIEIRGQHYHLRLTDGTDGIGGNVKAVVFNVAGTPLAEVLSGIHRGDLIDIMGTLAVRDYCGIPLAYIRLEDIAVP